MTLITNFSSLLGPFTFWTGSRCGQVRVRGGFQQGALTVLLFFNLLESSISRNEHRPPQSMHSFSFEVSLSRRRPLRCWLRTTLSNKKPYSSSDPWPTDDQARSMNWIRDKERDAPEKSCIQQQQDCEILHNLGTQLNTANQCSPSISKVGQSWVWTM